MTRRKLKDDYVNKVKEYHPKPNYFINCVKAFFVGGLICTIGSIDEILYTLFSFQ